MKKLILKFTFLLSAFILIIGCSTDGENPAEQELITANSFGDQTETPPTPCANNNLDTNGYCIEYIFVEYEPGLDRSVKNAIRAPYCSNMISIEVCASNTDIEIWTIRGNPDCAKEPILLPPTDPDLRQASTHSISNYRGCELQ
jgi:hypothetical protein